MAIIFCNVGWMEHYNGLGHGDKIKGGGSYVREKGRGHEVCNFSPIGNTLYGYVQPSKGSQIKIERIGASQDDESIGNVTVIWTATRPTGGTSIVGWYKNATVFREYQKFSKTSSSPHIHHGIDGYWIKAPLSGAKLLSVDKRTFEIPRQVKGGMGQANIWYADNPESAKLVQHVLDMVAGKLEHAKKLTRAKGVQNQDRKIRIEKAAIQECCKYFEGLGYTVTSVEKDNVGWDLEAASGKTTLRIEVKGLFANSFSVELTPNEYKAFSEESESYRLAVVTNALESPSLSICRYSKERSAWVIDEDADKSLRIGIKESALITCI